jgi:predicted nuclease of predicted toxin-antitoxin system
LGPDPGDQALLGIAAAEERIFITMDKDFGEFIFLRGASHHGLIRLPDVPSEERVLLLEEILRNHGQALAERAIITVRGGRIRISHPFI